MQLRTHAQKFFIKLSAKKPSMDPIEFLKSKPTEYFFQKMNESDSEISKRIGKINQFPEEQKSEKPGSFLDFSQK